MYDIGMRINSLREQRGISQRSLAKRINKSASAVCSYESNSQFPPLDVLISIAQVLNVSLDTIVGFDNSEAVLLDKLADDQKEILYLLLTEFSNCDRNSTELTTQQVLIIQKLIRLFTK